MSDTFQELIQAMEFAQSRFEQWGKDRVIGNGLAAITEDYNRQRQAVNVMAREGRPLPSDIPLLPADQCWSCRAAVVAGQAHCADCGAPVGQPLVQNLRYWTYTCYQIKAHCDAGRLPLAQAHAAMNDAKSRLAAIRNHLEKDRVGKAVVAAEAVPERESPASGAAVASSPPAADGRPSLAATFATVAARVREPRRPLWEIILDPRTIQWLLGLGGVLFVLGLVIWLATLGIFDHPWKVAVALGLGNAVVLAGGWAIIRFSRYQTAGRAITLLACLVMPLNLWFYHAQDLVTLDGNLWVAALVCCVLYLASALVLRDHVFVYVLDGGVAMTGLLMLADAGRFWEIASPAAMLVVLGLISIHVERAFADTEGPFSRRRFGLAFFRSGQVLLAAGLLLVLGAQFAGDWLYRPLFQPLYEHLNPGPPVIVAERWGQYPGPGPGPGRHLRLFLFRHRRAAAWASTSTWRCSRCCGPKCW